MKVYQKDQLIMIAVCVLGTAFTLLAVFVTQDWISSNLLWQYVFIVFDLLIWGIVSFAVSKFLPGFRRILLRRKLGRRYGR